MPFLQRCGNAPDALQAGALPLGSLALWPDSSGNQHTLVQPVPARQPVVTANPGYYGSVRAAVFRRAAQSSMEGGSDSYDLGIQSEFTVYIVGRSYLSTPQWVAGRGAYDYYTPSLQGWQWLVASDPWNPSPGSVGLHVVNSAGQAAGSYVTNGYSWQARSPNGAGGVRIQHLAHSWPLRADVRVRRRRQELPRGAASVAKSSRVRERERSQLDDVEPIERPR